MSFRPKQTPSILSGIERFVGIKKPVVFYILIAVLYPLVMVSKNHLLTSKPGMNVVVEILLIFAAALLGFVAVAAIANPVRWFTHRNGVITALVVWAVMMVAFAFLTLQANMGQESSTQAVLVYAIYKVLALGGLLGIALAWMRGAPGRSSK